MRKLMLLFLLLALAYTQATAIAGSLGDPFDGTGLQNAGWNWQNEPAEWDIGKTKDGWLHITAENNQNLWDVDTVAKLYHEVSDDQFDIETHLVIDYEGTGSLVAGLVAKGPSEDDWITLKFWGRGGDAILQWQSKQNEFVGNVPDSSQPAGVVEVFIRIAKDGDDYAGYWKKSKADDWIEITPANISLTPPLEVGIFAGNCEGAGTVLVEFEYFNDLLDPFQAAVDSSGKLATHWATIKCE